VIFDDVPTGHVLVTPPTLQQLQEWAATRGTDIVHPLTQVVLDAVVTIGKK